MQGGEIQNTWMAGNGEQGKGKRERRKKEEEEEGEAWM